MKKERELQDVDLEQVNGGGSSIQRPCRDCLPCPPPGGSSIGPEPVVRDEPEGTIRGVGEA